MIPWYLVILERVGTFAFNAGKGSYLVESDSDLVGLVVKTDVEVSKEDCSETVLVELVWDGLDAYEAVFLKIVAIEIALGLDCYLGLVDEEAQVAQDIIEVLALLSADHDVLSLNHLVHYGRIILLHLHHQ
jgi:hypothetical protein